MQENDLKYFNTIFNYDLNFKTVHSKPCLGFTRNTSNHTCS